MKETYWDNMTLDEKAKYLRDKINAQMRSVIEHLHEIDARLDKLEKTD